MSEKSIVILSDFNAGKEENYMLFCGNYNLKTTCYKNPDNPTCIGLILTNVPRIFQSTCVLETGLCDFHLMTLTIMRKRFKKFQPRVIYYRSYKHLKKWLLEKLSKDVLVNNDDGFQSLHDINITTFNEHDPSKKK